MPLPDLINGSFEVFASAAILLNCRAIHRAKRAIGFSAASVSFYTLWGLWSVFYLASLEQWLSLTAAIAIVATNALWVGMWLHYRHRPASFLAYELDGRRAAPRSVEERMTSRQFDAKFEILP